MSEWQPIETAPRDGRPVLLMEETSLDVTQLIHGGVMHCIPSICNLVLAFWAKPKEMWKDLRSGNYYAMEFTHWAPIPPLPTAKPKFTPADSLDQIISNIDRVDASRLAGFVRQIAMILKGHLDG